MKITVVCDVFGEINNGTMMATMNLIEHLRKKGHSITIVAPNAEAETEDNYYVVSSLNLGKFLNNVVERNGVVLARADEDILVESMKEADVVHVQIPLLLGCSAVKVARNLGKPITASFHCQAENITAHLGLMNNKRVNNLIYKRFYNKVYQYCDKVHYPTKFIQDVFESATDKTNAVVISNGVNPDFFKPVEKQKFDKYTIVCSGRYSKEKAQWQLLDAVSKSKHKDEIRVVLAGDGPYRESLAKQASKLGIDCVQRFFSREELIVLLNSADLYVHTALVEIEAIACMEAIVCGLVPLICNSERSATRYFAIDERNLFEPENTDELASKIDFWFENEDIKKEYAEKYKAKSLDFDLENCMERMEQMLISAVEEAKAKNNGN